MLQSNITSTSSTSQHMHARELRRYGYFSELTISHDSELSLTSDEEKYLEVDDVRITPSMTVFRDAFIGRNFNQKLVIQNCGKHSAFIRICAPTSYAFKIETNLHGQYLSPGLSIVRNISYTHLQQYVTPLAYFAIYINDQYVKYKISVVKSSPRIRAKPQYIDFGTINADFTTCTKTFLLINEDTRESRFAIDLGSNNLQLIVQPIRGTIMPKESVSIQVEALGQTEGYFLQEIWIKCESPFRIQVSVNFVLPKLTVFSSRGTSDFMFLDFPRTYLGTSCTKFVVIKNDSATPKMFCIMAEVNKKIITLPEARQEMSDFKCFYISPYEGRLNPFEGRIVEIIYTPKKMAKTGRPEYHDDYAICFIRIVQVNCQDLQDIVIFQVVPKEQEIPILSAKEHISDTMSVSVDEASNWSSLHSTATIEPAKVPKSSFGNVDVEKNKFRRVCLHGEIEIADMSIRPNSLHLTDLYMNQEENRELLLINNSRHLHVLFRYKKCANIEIIPNEGDLKPLEELEVNVKIIPKKIGQIQTTISFEIFYKNLPENVNALVGSSSIPVYYKVSATTSQPKPKFNMGITPQITNEVGFLTNNVRFNSPVVKPRAAIVNERKNFVDDGDLIAFPNDRPASLRPWKCDVQCKTIFAGMPRLETDEDMYALSESDRRIKKLLAAHYNKYIRSKQITNKQIPKSTEYLNKPDYEIGDNRNLLLKNFKLKCPAVAITKNDKLTFIPMTPTQLYRVKVYPLVINLEKIATNSSAFVWVKIINENNISVRIYLECRHESISYQGGPRIVVKPNSESRFQIKYTATDVGRYNVPIDMVLNESHFTRIMLLAEVVTKFVTINCERVQFFSDDIEPKYIEILNPLNEPVRFRWEVPKSCFAIQPLTGLVGSKKVCYCLVTYTPHIRASMQTYVILILENNANITIQISVIMKEPNITLQNNELLIKNIPLNIPVKKKFVLRNNGFEPISIHIPNLEPALGMKIYPCDFILHGKGNMIITIAVKVDSCENFSCIVQLTLQRLYEIQIKILCEVDYPHIVIEPDELNFRKLFVNCAKRLEFYVANKSDALTNLNFNFEDFPEFVISDSIVKTIPPTSKKRMVLQPNESKLLFLSYFPTEVAYYNFFLPITVNDLLGPALKSHCGSVLSQTDSKHVQFNQSDSSTKVNPIEGIKVIAKAQAAIMTISQYTFIFSYFPNLTYKSVIKHKLEISNVSSEQIDVCIRTDDLLENYSLTPLHDAEIKIYPMSHVCNLNPNNTVVYIINFHPPTPGIYNISLPIYVKDQLQGSLFNYVNLYGTYPEASLETEESIVYLEPVPLGCFSNKIITLKRSFHKGACFITANVSSKSISVNFIDGNNVTTENSQVRVNICFKAISSINGQETVVFSCKCPAECKIFVIFSSENSIVTTHAFLQTNRLQDFADVFPDFILNANSKQNSSVLHDIVTTSEPDIEKHTYENAVNPNKTSYPLFPDNNDNSKYAEYMLTTLAVLENWVYKQCFYSQEFFSIPEGIAAYPVKFDDDKINSKRVKKGKKEKEEKIGFIPHFVELLKHLAGLDIEDLISERPLPEETIERVNHIYSLYKNILEMLTMKQAYLLHVRPEHLLEYEDYVEYMENIYTRHEASPIITQSKTLDEITFHRLAKQSWMDVILQTFKLFVLSRLQTPLRKASSTKLYQNSNSSTNVAQDKSSKNLLIGVKPRLFTKLFEQMPLPQPNIYSKSELMLLSWLEYNFDEQRETLWKNVADSCELTHRHVQHFDKDLCDSIVLAAVTAAYCPYFAHRLKKMYLKPDTYEKYFYNAYQLTEVWRSVNSSFDILPDQIVNPNIIQMLLLVTYLYDFLPGLQPNESIVMTADHTKSIQEQITIYNPSKYVVAYRIKFFGDDKKFFEANSDSLIIKSNKEIPLKITLHARKLARVHSTLILCGDTPGYYYAKSITFDLNGIPNTSYTNGTLHYHGYIYQVTTIPYNIYSPYIGAASYEINYSELVPEHIDDLYPRPIPYRVFKTQALPRRVYTNANKIDCNSWGVGGFDASYCTSVPVKREGLVYFMNKEVGDFSYKLLLTVDNTRTKYETISLRLPRSLKTLVCNCKKAKLAAKQVGIKCPRELSLNVPRKNNIMWACIEKMFFKCLKKEDMTFWTNAFETSAGHHLLKYIFDTNRELAPRDLKHVYNKTVTYKVVPDKKPPPPATLPHLVTIDDVLTAGNFCMPLHVNSNRPKDFFFNMLSNDEMEIRFYKVVFLPEI